MDGPEPRRLNPRRQVILVILIVLVVYAFLMGRQGSALDVALSGGYAIVAAGSNGGVRFLDVANPATPKEIGWYDTPGSAQAVVLSGRNAFIADGKRGLRVLDLASLLKPAEIGAVELAGEVIDVSLAGNYAYLSRGEFGVTIVDISRPGAPLAVASIDTPGEANATAITQIISVPPGLTPGTPEYQQQVRLQAVYVYVADGAKGLQVYDAISPVEPKLLGNYDTKGQAVDVALLGPYAVLADDKAGVHLIDITNPSQPSLVAEVDTPGEALHVAVASPLVYVADGGSGLQVIDFTNIQKPKLLSATDLPGSSLSVAVKDDRAFMVQGENGISILNVRQPRLPVPVGTYETPGDASFGQVVKSIPSIFTGKIGDVQTKVWRTFLVIFLDLVLLALALFFWLYVYAQFALPVRTISDRQRAFERLYSYFFGDRGPAIFIKNGKYSTREREKERRGPGVAILDTASGAVFRNRQGFTQAGGPGLTFTNRGEYVAGAVDLRRQSVTIGPNVDEDPFAPQGEDEDPTVYTQRRERCLRTRGLTRDGIEIAPRISCGFHLISTPGEGNTQFGYSPISVRNAIASESIDPSALPNSDSRRIPWTAMPCTLAADVWREYLQKYTLNQLFSFNEGEGDAHQTAYEKIAEMVKARLTTPDVDDLDESGKATGETNPSIEYALLKERGIEVNSVTIGSLRFPMEIERRLVDQWTTGWLERARKESDQVNQLHQGERKHGEEQALKQLASAASLALASARRDQPDLSPGLSLEQILAGVQDLCSRDPALLSRLTNQQDRLNEIIEWVRAQQA